MANALAPFGFRSLRHAGGGDPTRSNPHKIAAGYATDIFEGDFVKSDGAGNIAKAAAGDAVLGRFKGCEYVSADGSYVFRNWWQASTPTKAGEKIICNVEDDPNLTFCVQTNNTVLYADVGAFVDIATATGNTVTGRSTAAVGAPGGAASQFQIIRILDSEPVPMINADGITTNLVVPSDGANAHLEVKAVKHERAGAAFGIAV